MKEIINKKWNAKGSLLTEVTGLSYDSRTTKMGDLFIALKGESMDSHDYIEDVFNKGASSVIVQAGRVNYDYYKDKYPAAVFVETDDTREALAFVSDAFYRYPSQALDVIGVTGTNGKTTTSYIARSIMTKAKGMTGLIGTISYISGNARLDAPRTTPEAPDFQSLLRRMADDGCSAVVSEVSSHALAQKRVDHTRFKTAVFTNLTRDHLDFHKDMESYYSAKKRLFSELLVDGGSAVINIDDEYGARLAAELSASRGSSIKIITYAVKNSEADLAAENIEFAYTGTKFRIKLSSRVSTEAGFMDISSKLVGYSNVFNVLCAAAIGLSNNISIENIKEGIVMTEMVKGRFECVDLGQDFLAVVDYAHTEDALEGLLNTAHQLLDSYHYAGKAGRLAKMRKDRFSLPTVKGRGKIITVFGCGGNRDKGKRPKMGELAARLSDFVIITSDNPRGEDPKKILKDIEKGVKGDNYIVIPDRSVAISLAVELASSGDILLVAGKGHEEYQEIQGARFSFSDKTTLETAIKRTITRPAFGGGTNYMGSEAARC
ncbi:MAG: UDP-N-acetylmuramoyl-L-alanyl-D-glutamate--2,6-diaminopimelate ligase [Dissulfurispiraceae bacterium]|nr:UDP-N-acetylmuramoyl-L-alanyl-D-glutamate--2,6-diaminopimelate ligase [Dissulfurispiraceae bacterium]